MEYSPMMVIVLWALTPSDCLPIENRTTTEVAATVQEIARPAMTIQNPSQFTIPGYFTFNDGQPFLVEKDPLTGNLNFNIKTTPVKSSEQLFQNSDDYMYDDSDYSKDQIDRKDGDIYGNKPIRENDIKGTSKMKDDLHQFLNLPVHYSTNGKFPLISSSYANTKVQGHGSSSYSNHKPYSTTPTTVSPTYYTHKSKLTTTTTAPTIPTSTITSTTKKPLPSTPPIGTTTTTNAYDYEYDEYDYDKYEPEKEGNVKSTTTEAPVFFQSTVMKIETTTTSTPQKPVVSIVTSLPIDHYEEEEIDKTPLSTKLSTTTKKNEQTMTNNEILIKDNKNQSSFVPPSGFVNNGINIIMDGQHSENNPPVQSVSNPNPISGFNSGSIRNSTQTRPTGFDHGVSIPQGPVGQRPQWTYGVPPFQPIGSNIPVNPMKIPYPHNPNLRPNFEDSINPGLGLSGPQGQTHTYLTVGSNPAIPPPHKMPSFFPNDPPNVGLGGFHSHNKYYTGSQKNQPNNEENINIMVNSDMPQVVQAKLNFSSPQEVMRPSNPSLDYNKPPLQPGLINQGFNLQFNNVPPHGRPQVAPPNQRPPATYVENQSRPPGSFSLIPKTDNQFIQVSKDQVNPSYSLQTSFSIGAPQYDVEEKEDPRPVKGIGQVLFPDDDKLKPNEGSNHHEQWPVHPGNPKNPPQGAVRPHAPPPQGNIGPPPQRYPTDLLPPAPPVESYPRPPWQTHLKPPYMFNSGNSLQKKDIISPSQSYLPPKRSKPPNPLQRHDLPNILPQFRPNAKVGHVDHHTTYIGPSKPREPFDTLQPPPLPRPQYYRVQNNDDNIPDPNLEIKKEQLPIQPPLVHRRTGQQAGSRVTTLQMMQQNPPRKAILRTDYKDYDKKNKDEPVFVVYPSNGGLKPTSNTGPIYNNDGVVVVGTRGSQRPLPPDNLDIEDDLDAFPLDDNNHFPIHARDRVDTPILKSKSTPKPIIKPEFPYPIVKPGNVEVEERIITGVEVKKEYTAYSPTISSSTEEVLKDHDSEINLIPYLQDYMPFGTKKPFPSKSAETQGWNFEGKSTLRPISVTLNTLLGQTTNNPMKNHFIITTSERTLESKPEGSLEIIHAEKTSNKDGSPEPQDFLAPFHASLSEPSQGWSVVTSSVDKASTEQTTHAATVSSKFDIDSFKPELLSGFKPILPPAFDDDRPSKET